MGLTLNQVVKNLEYISQAHNQINTFYFGQLHDFAASGVINYPAMVVDLNPTTYGVNTLTYSFNIYLLDLVHKDISNSTEVLSDTVQMCTDILSIVDNPVYDWTLERSAILQDIQGEKEQDEVFGHWFNLRLKVPKPRDRCEVPTYGTITVIVPSENTSGLLDENGNIIQTEDGFYLIND